MTQNFEITYSRGIHACSAEMQLGLGIAKYQGNWLHLLVSKPDGQLSVFQHCVRLHVVEEPSEPPAQTSWMMSQCQVLRFENMLKRQQSADGGAASRCGLQIVNVDRGEVSHWLRIEGEIRELCDVVVLPNVHRPRAAGVLDDEVNHNIWFKDEEGRHRSWTAGMKTSGPPAVSPLPKPGTDV